MSTTSSDSHLDPTSSKPVSTSLDYILTHVFLPFKLPRCHEPTPEKDHALLRTVCTAAHAYTAHLSGTCALRWPHIIKMLDNLESSIQSGRLDKDQVISQLRDMGTGDTLAFFIRPQNAAVIITKHDNHTSFELFEVSPNEDAVEKAEGALICSYPGSAVEISSDVFDEDDLQSELAGFLSHPDAENPYLPPPPHGRPEYITALLFGILRSVGRMDNTPCIAKRIRDDIYSSDYAEGRRSTLWLLVRVVIQTCFDRSPHGRTSYKHFMLFFLCSLARDGNDANISRKFLHLMACKILRRLNKLGTSTPDWLFEMAIKTCTALREVIHAKWKQPNTPISPFRSPSQAELIRDSESSFLNSGEYIHNALTNRDHKTLGPPFQPDRRRRGTIKDFLSSDGAFFEEAYKDDPDVTLYDVECAVEQGIDDWTAYVTNTSEACEQIEILMDKYMKRKWGLPLPLPPVETAEHRSAVLLTGIELFVALDKLAVGEIPMLADYSPEIPLEILEGMLLRKTSSLHRVARAYQYLFSRHCRSRSGWSIFSGEFTQDSLPVRYYDQSSDLQLLKARIEEDKAPLPESAILAKVVVFELQCPIHVRIWRSAVSRIRCYPGQRYPGTKSTSTLLSVFKEDLLSYVPEVQHYFIGHTGPPLFVQVHFASKGLQSRTNPMLSYAIEDWYPHDKNPQAVMLIQILSCDNYDFSSRLRYYMLFPAGLSEYLDVTSHSSNDVIAAQVNCPPDFSLDEFITFTHLRSSGSLQWLNILGGLRTRTLNFRRREVHTLLTFAVFQVGPLDLTTGTWVWHQELQDLSFCNALLDELETLFFDTKVGSIDRVAMDTISLLLTRILASSPGEGISDRVIAILRNVRSRTFKWVEELLYNLAMAPTNYERVLALRNMAVMCRSTFDVHPVYLPRLLHSAEDVDVLLSCALFIQALCHEETSVYSSPIPELVPLSQDHRISLVLESFLGETILADPSEYGLDLAVRKMFGRYQPGTQKWERLQYPNSCWLTCKTNVTMGQSLHIAHLDLINGELRVNGQSLCGLPHGIRDSPECRQIFCDQGFLVLPSDLAGMDFTTHTVGHRYRVHYSLRDDTLVLRAQCNQTRDIFELIPSYIFWKDLPVALVDGHVHWLDLSKKIIEIRPLDRLWDQSSENWRIDCTRSGRYHIYKGEETLVDVLSTTWDTISKHFECLNSVQGLRSKSRNILITTAPVKSPAQSVPMLQLSVTLPHYNLSFFVNKQDQLESGDFKDMIYDENQHIGTLFGLENFLVLCQKTELGGTLIPEALIPRRVLIPDGPPQEYADNQWRVQIRSRNSSFCHAYKVDSELGCLKGDGSTASVQYLANLHAATSYYDQPDPLTGKTGAQAALCLLQSGICRSVMESKALDTSDLKQYPQIKAAYKDIEHRYFWNDDDDDKDDDDKDANAALKRATQRAACLFAPNIIETNALEQHNSTRYSIPQSNLELQDIVSAVATAVYRWTGNTPTMDVISTWAELWLGNRDDVHVITAPSPSVHHDGVGSRSNLDLIQPFMIEARAILEKSEGTLRRFQLLFLLPMTAYCSPSYQAAFLSMLVVFSNQSHFNSGTISFIRDDYVALDGYCPSEEDIMDHTFPITPKYPVTSPTLASLVKELLEGWPPSIPPTISLDPRWQKVTSSTTNLQNFLSSCYHNFELKERLVKLFTEPRSLASPFPVLSQGYGPNERTVWQVTLALLLNRPAPELPSRSSLQYDCCRCGKTFSDRIPALDGLFSLLPTHTPFQREYLINLHASAHVPGETRTTCIVLDKNLVNLVRRHYVQCKTSYVSASDIIQRSLGPTSDPLEQALYQFGQWPQTTPDILLQHCLGTASQINVPPAWKKCLMLLALLLLDLQRSRRLLRSAVGGLEEEFLKELENEPCDGWDPEEYPDWLLIQIQGNFLVRRAQAEMAKEIMFPQSGENTVMQVNMGEGKSSVIIPIAAAALADGKQLVRVVVPKALTNQMFEILVTRLGGLVNRPVYYLPFSRAEYDTEGYEANKVHALMIRCMEERGILLLQPEHVVSPKLMAVAKQIVRHTGEFADNCLSDSQSLVYIRMMKNLSLNPVRLTEKTFVGNLFRWFNRLPDPNCLSKSSSADNKDLSSHGASDRATEWLKLWEWINSHARDILDESDEILHARFQLIYTLGFDQHMDGYPNRWIFSQQILSLVKEGALILSRSYPESIEYEDGPPGSFPHVRIVRASDVGQKLISLIAEYVMAGRLPGFNFQNISPALHEAIRAFISDEKVSEVPDTVQRVKDYAQVSQHSHLWSGLLLLRGLLTSNVLLLALSEWKWYVNYGLPVDFAELSWHTHNPLLAVPYRAKGMPAPNTQFGHPDVAIVLTCLSYYYGGLTEGQLRTAFQILLDGDDPFKEYAHWIKEYDSKSLPKSLQNLDGINLRSSEEWDKTTFSLFTSNKATIDFYLSRVVFPRKAKEFPWKLCSSSWDLAEKREKLVTGFSGTNDGRWLLPLSIAQRDPEHQKGTNARVLAHLLRPENDSYMITHENGKLWDTVQFLHVVATTQREIRVLLDVGALILDLSNRQVVEEWLNISRDTFGAVYFDEDDELTVLTRTGDVQPMSLSPLSRQLHRCVIYLDHAHTRGTDLNFPINYRAAVTLGPKLTKDNLVQGCMRMRKLGHGHSVMFFAPPEVDWSIRAAVGKKDKTQVTTVDILCWAVNETWNDIQRRAPHWAQQGMSHKARYEALNRFCGDDLTRQELSGAWLQPERKSLSDMYAPRETQDSSDNRTLLDPEIRQRCKTLGILSLPNAPFLEEEQERQTSREQEREREVELPPKAEPAEHSLHPDVITFVETGDLPPLHTGSAFLPVFTALENSTAATRDADVWSPHILATADFSRTIQPESTRGTMDQYLRPVQWILTRRIQAGRDQVLVLLSPFEANSLLPDIRVSEHVHLHLYAPRTSQRMKPSDDLRLYTLPQLPSDWTPPWSLIDQLNVFAGQLYIRDYQSYLRLCRFLGVRTTESSEDGEIRRNLFNIPGSFEEHEITFSDSPLPFVTALLGIRNRGRPFAHTHMGKILQGEVLKEIDFSGPPPVASTERHLAAASQHSR